MYSADIHKAIVKTYKTVEAYEAALGEVMRRVDISDECQLVLEAKDTCETILIKLRDLPTVSRHNTWVMGAVLEGKFVDLRAPLFEFLMEAMKELVRVGDYPATAVLHIRGFKPCEGVIHPEYLKAFLPSTSAEGVVKPAKYSLAPAALEVWGGKFPYYGPCDNMPEMTLAFNGVDKDILLGAMAFRFSNFHALLSAIVFEEFDMAYPGSEWKTAAATTRYLSGEQMVQALKAFASISKKHAITDEADALASLKSRLTKLAELGYHLELVEEGPRGVLDDADGVTRQFPTALALDQFINRQIVERVRVCTDPKLLKKLGNAVGLKASYFGIMNGAIVDPFAPVWSNVGNNARVMALNILMRMLRGDTKLIEFISLARKFRISIFELAVHGDGAYPDECWGVAACSARISPAAHLVRGGRIFNCFGNGVNAVIQALNHSVEALDFLGLHAEFDLEKKEELALAVSIVFAKVLDTISAD